MKSIHKILLLLLVPFLLGVWMSHAHAAQHSEKDKIEFLLDAIEKSNLTFIREGKDYKGKDARDHLQGKLDYAGDRIKTAEQFITYIASKSSITGKPYYVVMPDGTKMESKEWLEKKLAEFK